MIHNILEKYKDIFIDSINKLKGSDRRTAIAMVSKIIGKGGQRLSAEEFNVSRNTIRKGTYELESGIKIVDAFNARGRKKAEEKLPNLLKDIKDIADFESQTDPSFKSTRLYTRLTVKEIRNQLIAQKQYKDEELPTNATLNTKINELGYNLKKVRKVKPLKKIEQTDAIFENLKKVHSENKGKDNVVRISVDTKDKVKIGEFSRGGFSRTNTQAGDHDFCNGFITPFGILDVTADKLEYVFTQTKVTADFMVDAIENYWIESGYQYSKDTLIINADNGPENNSHRTQFMKRVIEFSAKYSVKVILAYYPPYHSKYNPIERTWGVLEQHWNGSILNSVESVLGFAGSMTWKGEKPVIKFIKKTYETGKKVVKDIMAVYESMIDRKEGLGKWFITTNPNKCKRALDMEIKV